MVQRMVLHCLHITSAAREVQTTNFLFCIVVHELFVQILWIFFLISGSCCSNKNRCSIATIGVLIVIFGEFKIAIGRSDEVLLPLLSQFLLLLLLLLFYQIERFGDSWYADRPCFMKR